MYSAHNEGKSVVAEWFIRILKTIIYKYMTLVLKNVYINKLGDIVGEYVHIIEQLRWNLLMLRLKILPKFKFGDYVWISKYKNIFAKGYTPNWSEEVFIVNKIKNKVPWTYVINYLNGEEIIGTFYEKELQKTNQKKFRIDKVIRRKGDRLHVKWKDYDNSFNSRIDKKLVWFC